MEKHEAGRCGRYEGGDVRRGELIDAFEIPDLVNHEIQNFELIACSLMIHLIVGPLKLIYIVQATVDDEWVHMTSLLTESSNTIAALLGGAEFKLEEGLVPCTDDAEIVGHGFANLARTLSIIAMSPST